VSLDDQSLELEAPAAAGGSGALLVFGRGHPGRINQSMSFSITVVPPDAINLELQFCTQRMAKP
jgi:hypothetical protein